MAENVEKINENADEVETENRMSWSSFHSRKSEHDSVKCISALLPLINESVNSTAMVRHTINIIKCTLQKLNPGQVPGKQFQWS